MAGGLLGTAPGLPDVSRGSCWGLPHLPFPRARVRDGMANDGLTDDLCYHRRRAAERASRHGLHTVFGVEAHPGGDFAAHRRCDDRSRWTRPRSSLWARRYACAGWLRSAAASLLAVARPEPRCRENQRSMELFSSDAEAAVGLGHRNSLV